jgi:hypothetical protein
MMLQQDNASLARSVRVHEQIVIQGLHYTSQLYYYQRS